MATQEWNAAATSAARAVAMSPYDASVREFAATISMQRKDWTTAEKHIRALISIEPDREIHKQRLAALLKMVESAANPR